MGQGWFPFCIKSNIYQTILNHAQHQKKFSKNLLLTDDDIGDDHIMTSLSTPIRPDAFDLSDEEKMAKIEHHFREVMLTMGLDLTDDSLRGTPKRVAKMYIQEIFSGLNPKNKPKVAMFDNKYGYYEMLVEKDITFYSNCEHHFVSYYWQSPHCLHFSRQRHWPVKTQPHCAILCQKAASARTPHHADSAGTMRNPWNRRHCNYH